MPYTERYAHLSPEDYTKGVKLADANAARQGKTSVDLIKHIHQNSDQMTRRIVAGVANMLNPVDRSLGTPFFKPEDMRTTVGLGAAAGLLLVKYSYQPEDMTRSRVWSGEIELAACDPNDEMHARHQQAESVVNVAYEGLGEIGDLGYEWLDDQSDELVENVALRPYYLHGSGIAILSARSSFERILSDRRVALQQQIDQEPPDWDASIASLLGEPS